MHQLSLKKCKCYDKFMVLKHDTCVIKRELLSAKLCGDKICDFFIGGIIIIIIIVVFIYSVQVEIVLRVNAGKCLLCVEIHT